MNGTVWDCAIVTQREKSFKSWIAVTWEFQVKPLYMNISSFVIFSYFDPWIYSNVLIVDEDYWKQVAINSTVTQDWALNHVKYNSLVTTTEL